jgi:DNA polymerase-1
MADQSANRIFLLDTMSFIYRAYHAAAHQSVAMTTKAGFPSGAAYIFCRMLIKLKEEHKPEYMIALMDVPGATFRDEIDPTYKANRKGETPYDLVRQLPYMLRAVDAHRIPKLSLAGFEADDLIGTLARKAYRADPNNLIYIVSGDKDMYQLVNDRTFTVNPMKDQTADAAKVEEIVGVPPHQVVDVMALRGDTVDNVPGAPGIGKKGSVDIIKQFGTLEQAMFRTEEIKRKSYRESIQNNMDQIKLSKRLVTIDQLVPGIELDIESMKLGEPDTVGLATLYTELEFASLLKKEGLAAVEGFAEVVPPDHTETSTSMSSEQADNLIDSLF